MRNLLEECGSSGFGIGELLVSIALLSIVTMGTASYLNQTQTSQRVHLSAFNRDVLVNQLSRNLEYPRALAMTALFTGSGPFPANTAFNSCVNGVGGPAGCKTTPDQDLFLTDTLGNVVAGTAALPVYYNLDGKVCNTGPDPFCGIQAFTSFTPDCGGPAVCGSARSVRISFTLREAPGVNLAYNIHLRTFSTASTSPVPLYLAKIGTPGQLPLWVTDNTLGDSNITQYNGMIGVNTTNPQATLDILSGSSSPSNLLIEGHATLSSSPRLGLVDTFFGTVMNSPVWYADNFGDAFRIFRQKDIFTGGQTYLAVGPSGFQMGNGSYGSTPKSPFPSEAMQVLTDSPATDWANDVDLRSFTNSDFDLAFDLKRARGAKANPQPLLNGDTIGGLTAQGYNGTGFSTLGYIVARADQDLTGDYQQSLQIWSVANGTSVEAIHFSPSGNIGIGNQGYPTEKLHVNGQVHVYGTGPQCVLGGPGAGATSCTSDARLKRHIAPIQGALDRLLRIRGVEFDWNEKGRSPGRHDIGVIAQEVRGEFPSFVTENPATGFLMVDYAALVSPLVQAAHELVAEGSETSRLMRTEASELRKLRENLSAEQEAADARLRSRPAARFADPELRNRLKRLRDAIQARD